MNPEKSIHDLINEISSSGKDERIIAKTITTVIARLSKDTIKSIDELNGTIAENSKSSHILSKRLFCLNLILAIATFVGVVFTVLSFYK